MPETWTLMRKLKAEHVDDHAGFVAGREEVLAELKAIGVGAILMSSTKRKRRRHLKNKLDLLDRQIAACHCYPGSDLDPPRIGMDPKATKWFKKRMADSTEAWPLEPDAMVEEMHGRPVWELTKHQVLHQLDMDWPIAPFPVPEIPWLGLELTRSMQKNITPEDGAQLAEELDKAVGEHLRVAYPELAKTDWRGIVEAIIAGALPGHPPGGPADTDLKFGRSALITSTWLRFWGEHGYTLRHSAPVG